MEHAAVWVSHALPSCCSTTHKQVVWLYRKKRNKEVSHGVCFWLWVHTRANRPTRTPTRTQTWTSLSLKANLIGFVSKDGKKESLNWTCPECWASQPGNVDNCDSQQPNFGKWEHDTSRGIHAKSSALCISHCEVMIWSDTAPFHPRGPSEAVSWLWIEGQENWSAVCVSVCARAWVCARGMLR